MGNYNMDREIILNLWHYYLCLERDFDNTSRYIEPIGQEDTYSFEFVKIINLACSEVESVFRRLCEVINPNSKAGNMCQYKSTILTNYPKIVEAEVRVVRWGELIKPFQNWDTNKLDWWDNYQLVKHKRSENFKLANYRNAVFSISALYILILYLSQIAGVQLYDIDVTCIYSVYKDHITVFEGQSLPDFQ